MSEDTGNKSGDKDAVLQALHDCQQTLSQLKAGDDLVQQAENAFGQLANRVDSVLRERRVTPDRRAVVRAGLDRRRNNRGSAA